MYRKNIRSTRNKGLEEKTNQEIFTEIVVGDGLVATKELAGGTAV